MNTKLPLTRPFCFNCDMVQKELIFLDTETTGNDPFKDRLCQICYRTSKGTKTEYFKPPFPVPVKAMSITHITNEMLKGKRPFIGSEMHSELKNLLAGGILVAHNAKFDIAILKSEGIECPNVICTLRVARSLDKEDAIPEYNLQYLRYYLGLEVKGYPHDAESDVNVLEPLFHRLLSKIMEKIPDRDSAIQEMIKISSVPTLFKKFDFGKHKDKLVSEVAKTDRNYLEWLLKEKLKAGEQDEDWIHTLRHYL